ncbi:MULTISPECIES: SDR family NAD(P)-dependent oxidoreductase [unclassified Sphingomonas]|uniref:SDR family NAD(P)-dependent oxidoreductase n=1 Tax=unclassified Sphingomonas TaxID=196159 RepID=UPI0006F85DFD|nr:MULTISPECIES: SDR family oxidoreductase [unclassified Sphingomonas]KQX17630.1 oxidoreductase [Sphingomonas sp. Root1294]KQY70556.1 oxidoreductase [Sphingomonas sp. Root50]KRB91957.1 oxidoreductase [Sphingomonas sp. Root720]
MNRLQGKAILIAGASANIGAATAIRLADEGAAVMLGARSTDRTGAIAARIREKGGRAETVCFDAADDASIAAMVAHAAQTFGGLDGMFVNMAELTLHKQDTDAVTVPLEVFDRAVAVNLRGHLLCARHVVPVLLERGGGSIVFTSSSAAFMGRDRGISYTVTKHALTALMRHVATSWGKQGIRSNIVSPGLVLSEKNRNHPEMDKVLANTPSPRLGEPEDLAAAVAMLMSPDGEWINGQILCVDGGVVMR